MLVTVHSINTPTVKRLIKFWADRYIPNLSPLPSVGKNPESYLELVKANSPEGRALTVAKLHERLITIKCQMAGIQTNVLYAYIPNIVNLAEARRLTEFACLIYLKLLEIYQQSSSTVPEEQAILPATTSQETSYSPREILTRSAWGMPSIEEIAIAIQPILLEFQHQHIVSKDWRTLGFITTFLNFSNQLLSYNLTPFEKALIQPYFKFIEEQVALPWQRVCMAAAKHQISSPAFTLVEQMFPASREIAEIVYRRLVQLLPNHCSRRGKLINLEITHSCLRDLEMFQAYLWLCFLEENMAAIESELVDLCVMVLPGVQVKWEMTELWNQVLTEEIISRLTPSQKTLLQPYTKGLQEAFLKQRDRFLVPTEDGQEKDRLITTKLNQLTFEPPLLTEDSPNSDQLENEITRLNNKLVQLEQELNSLRVQLDEDST